MAGLSDIKGYSKVKKVLICSNNNYFASQIKKRTIFFKEKKELNIKFLKNKSRYNFLSTLEQCC